MGACAALLLAACSQTPPESSPPHPDLQWRLVREDAKCAGCRQYHWASGYETTLFLGAPVLRARDVASVGPGITMDGNTGLEVRFAPASYDKVERLTTTNVDKAIAIVVGDRVLSVARIVSPYREGSITAGLEHREAWDLYRAMRAEPPPAPAH